MARASRPASVQPAFVLHRYDWSETSLILDLFTRGMGRVAVAAKGAKRPYSQLRSVLLPFQRLQVGLTRPRDGEAVDVQTLRSAEWAGGAPMLSGAALFSGFYLNELLMKLIGRDDPHPRLFDAYAGTLPALAAGGDHEQAGLRAFELVLLREMGVLPDLGTTTVDAQAVSADASYLLRADAGVWRVQGGGESGVRGQALIAVDTALAGDDLSALQTACGADLAGLKQQLRGLLHYHLGSPHLRSRQVMLDVQRLIDRPPTPR
jgi:DNA repair protein RecO (recombination protein O)